MIGTEFTQRMAPVASGLARAAVDLGDRLVLGTDFPTSRTPTPRSCGPSRTGRWPMTVLGEPFPAPGAARHPGPSAGHHSGPSSVDEGSCGRSLREGGGHVLGDTV